MDPHYRQGDTVGGIHLPGHELQLFKERLGHHGGLIRGMYKRLHHLAPERLQTHPDCGPHREFTIPLGPAHIPLEPKVELVLLLTFCSLRLVGFCRGPAHTMAAPGPGIHHGTRQVVQNSFHTSLQESLKGSALSTFYRKESYCQSDYVRVDRLNKCQGDCDQSGCR